MTAITLKTLINYHPYGKIVYNCRIIVWDISVSTEMQWLEEMDDRKPWLYSIQLLQQLNSCNEFPKPLIVREEKRMNQKNLLFCKKITIFALAFLSRAKKNNDICRAYNWTA